MIAHRIPKNCVIGESEHVFSEICRIGINKLLAIVVNYSEATYGCPIGKFFEWEQVCRFNERKNIIKPDKVRPNIADLKNWGFILIYYFKVSRTAIILPIKLQSRIQVAFFVNQSKIIIGIPSTGPRKENKKTIFLQHNMHICCLLNQRVCYFLKQGIRLSITKFVNIYRKWLVVAQSNKNCFAIFWKFWRFPLGIGPFSINQRFCIDEPIHNAIWNFKKNTNESDCRNDNCKAGRNSNPSPPYEWN